MKEASNRSSQICGHRGSPAGDTNLGVRRDGGGDDATLSDDLGSDLVAVPGGRRHLDRGQSPGGMFTLDVDEIRRSAGSPTARTLTKSPSSQRAQSMSWIALSATVSRVDPPRGAIALRWTLRNQMSSCASARGRLHSSEGVAPGTKDSGVFLAASLRHTCRRWGQTRDRRIRHH